MKINMQVIGQFCFFRFQLYNIYHWNILQISWWAEVKFSNFSIGKIVKIKVQWKASSCRVGEAIVMNDEQRQHETL